MKTNWLGCIGLLASLVAATNAHAIDFGGRLSIGGGGGQAYPIIPRTFDDATEDGPLWTARLQYGVINELSLVASYTNLLHKNKITGQEIRFRPITLGLRYHPFHRWAVSPYLTAGAGISLNKQELAPSNSEEWNKFSAQGGAGVEIFINQGASVSVEGQYHHFAANGRESDFGLLTVTGLIHIYFGEEERTRKARAEAEKARREAEAAREQARNERAKADEMLAQAKAAREQAEAARSQASESRQLAEASERAAREAGERAERARLAASEAEGARKKAQAELDQIKQMIARKDISPINFASGSSEILKESFPVLDLVAQTAAKYPTLLLRVEGHTDNVGKDVFNLRLSQRRAEAVKQYIVQKANLAKDGVIAAGFGETRPIASNKTPQGRAKNRRVEFIFIIK